MSELLPTNQTRRGQPQAQTHLLRAAGSAAVRCTPRAGIDALTTASPLPQNLALVREARFAATLHVAATAMTMETLRMIQTRQAITAEH